MKQILLPIWKEEKAGRAREPHPEKKMILLFLKVESLMARQRASLSPFYLKTKTQEAKIMKSSAAFHGRVMPIGWRIKNLEVMKITGEAGILAPDLLPAL